MTKILPFVFMGFLSFLFGGCSTTNQRTATKVNQAASQLGWFEIEMTPFQFRIGMGRDVSGPGLIAYKPNGSGECVTHLFEQKDAAESYDFILRSLEALLVKHDVMNIPQHEPDKFHLTEPARSEPAMYIRFVWNKTMWQSRFRANEIPPNMQALYEECRVLAKTVCERGTKRRLSYEEVDEINRRK